ncbi:YncE family protein [Geomonas limicola]|uniref:YncE family protein n=1 Tax=Geomonas limicola TaxID=2740186 RepID=UPI00162250B7|nr:YncE family protein [Geomonas limicola]
MKQALTNDGEVYLYLQPLPQESAKLRFELESASALRTDGVDVPLTLTRARYDGNGPQRQVLVATGVLAPGRYRGIYLKAKSAVLQQQEGEVALPVAATQELAELPFDVVRQKARVLSLSFKYRESVGAGNAFRPVFSLFFPERPPVNLTGYATNFASNSVTVFDKKSGEVRHVIATGQGPRTVLFNRNGLLAYVIVSGENRIEVIDVSSHEIINRIRLNNGDTPSEAVLTPDARTLLVANTGSNTVSIVDPTSNFETTRLNVGNMPRSILLDPAGRRAFVFNTFSNNITVIDVTSRSIVATVTTEASPMRGDFNRRGDKLYVFCQWSPYIFVYDTTTFAVTKRLYVGMGVSAIKVDGATDRLYVAKNGSKLVDIYDPFSPIPMDSLQVAGWPGYFLIDSDESNLLMVLPEQNALESINLVSKKGRFLLDTGGAPFWSTIMGER